ncbi:MAG: hypothetical protein JO069_20000 [Verrucomicrobia bacterium]|nr:hypothetical protein [Verrucomicrobiota bacterium]
MYPAEPVRTPLANAWTYDAFLKYAETAHQDGKAFALGLGGTSDSIDQVGAMFAAFGAALVDSKAGWTTDTIRPCFGWDPIEAVQVRSMESSPPVAT